MLEKKAKRNARPIELLGTPISSAHIISGNFSSSRVNLPRDFRICGVGSFVYEAGYSEMLEDPETINYLTEIFEKSENGFKVYGILPERYLVYARDKTNKTLNINREMVAFLKNKIEEDNKKLPRELASFDPLKSCKTRSEQPRRSPSSGR